MEEIELYKTVGTLLIVGLGSMWLWLTIVYYSESCIQPEKINTMIEHLTNMKVSIEYYSGLHMQQTITRSH